MTKVKAHYRNIRGKSTHVRRHTRRTKQIAPNRFKLAKYKGVWYEQGSTPTWFSKGCKNTKAKYTPKNGEVIVVNSCDTKDGKQQAEGRAYPTNEKMKLDVGFFPSKNPIFLGEYNIAYLEGKNGRYSNAIVKSNNNAWILSRKKKITNANYRRLKAIAKSKGIKTSKIKRTYQG